MTQDTPSSGSAVAVTYDALGREAMTGVGGAYTEFVYAPDGSKLGTMNGQTITSAKVQLPGGGAAVYGSGAALVRYWHADGLGSMRLFSNPNQTYYAGTAFAPYGELYATTLSAATFAGLPSDTSSELNDAVFREYNSTEGRWLSPDPAGLAAVDLTNPQSLNRYAYVGNNPTTLIDPLGLGPQHPPSCTTMQCAWQYYGGSLFKGYRGPDQAICTSQGISGPCGSDEFDTITGGIVQGPANCGAEYQSCVSVGPGLVAPVEVSGSRATISVPGGCVSAGSPGNMGPATCQPGYELTTTVNNVDPDQAYMQAVFSQVYQQAAGPVYAAAIGTVAAIALPAAAGEFATTAAGDFLFARGGAGLLNANNFLRIGWGWYGSNIIDFLPVGGEVFRVVVGSPSGLFHWHLWPF